MAIANASRERPRQQTLVQIMEKQEEMKLKRYLCLTLNKFYYLTLDITNASGSITNDVESNF